MTTNIPAFAEWANKRIELKHNWFDRLADVVRNYPVGRNLPQSLSHWPKEYPHLLEWISEAVQTLSPQQVLDLPAFDAWPEDFRNYYKQALHEEYLQSALSVNQIVKDCLKELKQLDSELRPMLEPGGPMLHASRRSKIAEALDKVAKRLRDLPETIQWPKRVENELPSLLVIDDLLGRVTSSPDVKSVLAPNAETEIFELRRAFCERFRLLDEEFPFESEQFSHAIARAEFCSGQRYDTERGFVNDLSIVQERFKQNGNGAPWALVVADVLFNTGRPNEHGRGNGESQFGIDEVVPWLRQNAAALPVVALTTEGGSSLIERVHDLGVDYLHRTDSSYVDMLIRVARGKRATVSQLRQAMHVAEDFVAADSRMLEVLTDAWDIAQDEAGKTVLITGEPGTGKERLAKFIHDMSPRTNQKLRFVNCAQYSKELADSELFGYYAGAFTGAANIDTNGIFQEADQGTLVLDEFADLDKDVQVKLLRTLEPRRANTRPVEPRGNRRQNSKLQTTVNVRVICCTNQPISQVRTDLRTRVAKIIEIPPLRERPADITALAKHFLSSPERINAPGLSLSDDAIQFLINSDLPGNARTLEQLLEVAAVGRGRRNIIRPLDLEQAWSSVFMGLSDETQNVIPLPQKQPAVADALPKSSPSAVVSDDLSQAIATIVSTARDEQKWLHFSKAETDALDEHLEGRLIDVISILIEWAIFRSEEVPAISSYLTGQTGQGTKGRVPEDVVKRMLKLDPKVLNDVLASPYLPENARLRKVIDECKRDWERRTKGKTQGLAANS
jgi:DNA-binding NtrC family response regulator